jgi:hypothetical protein
MISKSDEAHLQEALDRINRWEAGKEAPRRSSTLRTPRDRRALLTDRPIEFLRIIRTKRPDSSRPVAKRLDRDSRSTPTTTSFTSSRPDEQSTPPTRTTPSKSASNSQRRTRLTTKHLPERTPTWKIPAPLRRHETSLNPRRLVHKTTRSTNEAKRPTSHRAHFSHNYVNYRFPDVPLLIPKWAL